jgi:hypothetical protein
MEILVETLKKRGCMLTLPGFNAESSLTEQDDFLRRSFGPPGPFIHTNRSESVEPAWIWWHGAEVGSCHISGGRIHCKIIAVLV